MLALNTRKLSTTLLLGFAILIAVSTVAEAAHDAPLQQRDHINLKRIVRKRSPQLTGPDGLPVVIGAAPIPDSSSSSTSSESTTAVSSSTTSAAESSTSSSTTTSASGTDSTVSGSSTTSGTESTTSSSTTSSATSTTTPPPPAATTPAPGNAQVETHVTQVKSTKTLVTSVNAEETAPPQLAGAAKTSSNVVTILIAVAASIGGVAILWTIFRKWKLGSSKKFEDRLQPIDWKPSGHDDDGIIPAHRRNSGNSFATSPRRNDQLEHDFTAGPTHVSPVGGYADMSRGPSPQMRENRGYEYGGRY
ncbi:hypothetical protein EST38_g11383 [Candolleomyces aberdarensis]|uniref:Mid2 domain-containing protein n=1 Tax=Candolleomyces aberdarensis TaxID=2316362 RepID=A0A4Q2D5M7_9AGAR|nr:hypothetical protein EST38_g11383 [Candolleomyces aberdarensis]